MRVFLTGGSGLIGSAVIAELLAHGHQVTALVRSEAGQRTVEAAGAEPLAGSLADLDALRQGAEKADGVIHLAFGNDYSSVEAIAASIEEDEAAQRTLGEVLVGSDRPLAVVSGTPWIPGQLSTEADPLPTEGIVGGRARIVNATLALADQGVRTSAVRMPRTVHKHGEGGFAGLLTTLARSSGVSGVPGDGTQRWPAVHADDAASLFRLALEQAPAGTAWHAVGDEGDAVRDIAAVIGEQLAIPVQPMPDEHFGAFAPVFAMDQPSTSRHTQAELGWRPTGLSLLEDLRNLRP